MRGTTTQNDGGLGNAGQKRKILKWSGQIAFEGSRKKKKKKIESKKEGQTAVGPSRRVAKVVSSTKLQRQSAINGKLSPISMSRGRWRRQ